MDESSRGDPRCLSKHIETAMTDRCLKIGILGTRGIPNRYGGFEQLAEYLSAGLAEKGHQVTVYCSHKHPYLQSEWNKVRLVHCNDPEYKIGTAGQFIYDLNCIKHAGKEKFDVLLFLGYTSSSVWGWFYPKSVTIISNMDGLEWKRSKYSSLVQSFLRYAEKLAIKYSDYFIADSLAIQSYLENKYRIKSQYIAYGAEVFNNENPDLLSDYGLLKWQYYMIMARMEPENNIETILNGFNKSRTDKKIIVVGNIQNKFGQHLVQKFSSNKSVIFLGPVYDANVVHTLKVYSYIYFHGHSVGGTNPSLLEAMASRTFIAAHNNEFNKAILKDDASFFSDSDEVKVIIENTERGSLEEQMIENNIKKVHEEFNWPLIIGKYENFILNCHFDKHK